MTDHKIQRLLQQQLSDFPETAVTQGLPITFILRYCEVTKREPILQGNWSQLCNSNAVGIMVQLTEAVAQLAAENQALSFIQQVPLTGLTGQLLVACRDCVEQLPLDSHGFDVIIQFLATLAGKRNQLASMQTLAKLAMQLLGIKSGAIYDGTAAFGLKVTTLAQLATGPVTVAAQEINPLRWLVGKLSFYINQIDGEFELGDVLAAPAFCRNQQQRKFDYALMTAPFSASYSDPRIQQDRYHRFEFGIPNRGTADLLFIQNTIAALNSNGRAIMLVSTGLLNRTGQGEGTIKQRLVDGDLIETIITLPTGIWTNKLTGGVAAMVVTKHKRPALAGKLHLIDASRLGTRSETGTVLTATDLTKIATWYADLTTISVVSKVIDNQQIENGNLDFHRYFETQNINSVVGPVTVDSQVYEQLPLAKVRLRDVATVFRGMNINKRRELTNGQGNFATIKLADVNIAGQIQSPQLTQIDGDPFAVRKYLIRPGDVLVACRGTQQKVAVLPQTKQAIVLSSDFIGLRLKPSMDPWYIKSFFDSPFGSFYLAKLRRGSQRTILNYRDVADLLILDVPLAQQHQVGEKVQQADRHYQDAIRAAERQRQIEYRELYRQLGVTKALRYPD